MVRRLIIFVLLIGGLVAGMTYYHVNTPSPYNSEIFFGQ